MLSQAAMMHEVTGGTKVMSVLTNYEPDVMEVSPVSKLLNTCCRRTCLYTFIPNIIWENKVPGLQDS